VKRDHCSASHGRRVQRTVTLLRCQINLFIMKFAQLGTQIKTQCKKENIGYKNTQKVHYEVHKNHIIKSTSDSQNSEI